MGAVTDNPLNADECRTLLTVASDSITSGLSSGQPLAVDAVRYSPALQAIRATFVTLKLNGQLRGCIGTLEASRPLIVDVAQNAFAAAFRDPRFSPVAFGENVLLRTHISILSPPEAMSFASEEDLLSQIRPGIDGLILEDGPRRGTFLPAVWESLPDTATFWAHLKRKANLPEDHWSKSLKVSRYTATSVG